MCYTANLSKYFTNYFFLSDFKNNSLVTRPLSNKHEIKYVFIAGVKIKNPLKAAR